MINKELEHKIFGECWAMFNKARKDDSDEGWQACINEAHRICEAYDNRKFHEKLVLAVAEEAETESKMKNKEKTAAYKAAGAAFQAAWKMFSCFIDNVDGFKQSGMQILSEYNKEYSGRFAKKLGSAIYAAVCADLNSDGAFMHDAYHFYMEFQNGITENAEDDALKKAESIIDVYPEHMLQMMDMYADLKKRGQKNAA